MLLLKLEPDAKTISRRFRKRYKKAVVEGFAYTGTWWHRKRLPVHFSERGASIYGYTPRSKSYQKRKRKAKGHNRPMVWTGASERLAKIKDVRAKYGRAPKVDVVLHARGLNRRPKKGRIKMHEEVIRVIPREKKQMLAGLMDRINRRLKRVGIT